MKPTSWITLPETQAMWFNEILSRLGYTTTIRDHPTISNHSTITIFGTTPADLQAAYDLFLEEYDRCIR